MWYGWTVVDEHYFGLALVIGILLGLRLSLVFRLGVWLG